MSIRIGFHVSIRRGFDGAAQAAVQAQCGTFQFFPKNPRSLAVKSFDPADAARCKERCLAHDIPSVAHAPYPVNLAADHPDLLEATVASLLNDLAIAEAAGAFGVVVHYGKYAGNDPLQGYRNIIQCLDRVLEVWEGKAQLLIENQAAGLGTTLEELVQIRTLSQYPERIGFCFDTCHAFASGLWDGRNWENVAERGRELGYWPHVRVVHLNDSRYASGSGKDFHANIGRGHIGDEPFREFLHSDVVRGLPFVLETPSSPELPVQLEMNHVRQLAER